MSKGTVTPIAGVLAGFAAATVTEASEAHTLRLAGAGRVSEVAADLFASVGLSLVAKGAKGASPKGAHASLLLVCTGDAPSKALIRGIAKSWAPVVQGLHSLVSTLHSVGACDAPCALPAWADPVALAAAAAAKAAKAKAAKAATAEGAGEDAGEDAGEADTTSTASAAPSAPSANLVAAAIKAKAYSSADVAVLLAALVAAGAVSADAVVTGVAVGDVVTS
jgi:NADH-quinone oxidoreductase subunit C